MLQNAEKMPNRKDTKRTYQSWIRVHILPKWGQPPITDLQARPIEMWLESLPLAPKSRAHIRGILHSLWNFSVWKQSIPMQVNPISLVTVKGASKRKRQPRSLTVEQILFASLAAERTVRQDCLGVRVFRVAYFGVPCIAVVRRGLAQPLAPCGARHDRQQTTCVRHTARLEANLTY